MTTTTAPWERLLCQSCYRSFDRAIKTGPKPKRCGDCEAARRAPVPESVALIRELAAPQHRRDCAMVNWARENTPIPDCDCTQARTPRVFDKVWLYGERLTVLAIIDRGNGPLVVTYDDAGFRVEYHADRLRWDDGAWR